MAAEGNTILEDSDYGVANFAFILSIGIFVGFDLLMFITSYISNTLHWCCWLYFFWMHTMKMIRSEIDRRENSHWTSRTNNITEGVGSIIGFVLLWSPWQGHLIGFILSFFLAFFMGVLSATLERIAKKHAIFESGTIRRLVWSDHNTNSDNTTTCCVCQNIFYIGDTYIVLPCQHMLHDDCGRAWLVHKQECPVCRANTENYNAEPL